MKKNKLLLIEELTHQDIMKSLYWTQCLLLAFTGIGIWLLFDSFSSYFQLFDWSDRRLVWGIVGGLTVVLIDFCFMKWLPHQYFDDGGINEKIFSN